MTHPDQQIETYVEQWRSGRLSGEELVIDVLATLRHFADIHAVDFGDADRIAYSHYLNEKEGTDNA